MLIRLRLVQIYKEQWMCLEAWHQPLPYLKYSNVVLCNKQYKVLPDELHRLLNNFNRVRLLLDNKWYREPHNKLYKLLKVHPSSKLPL